MASFRKAIDNKCRDCIYDPHAPGTWRQQVEACEVTSCPLHPVRPRSSTRLSPEAYNRYHNTPDRN